MSLLMRQYLMTKDKFVTRYPHSWLVWEPAAEALRGGVDVSVAETRTGGTAEAQRPIGVDVLCFALKVPEGGSSIKVGRAADNQLVVSDPLVSRLHARLDFMGGSWSLVPLSETKKTTVQGNEVARGTPVQLQSGHVVELGGVKVTFYDADAFKARVATAGTPKR